MNLEHSSFNFDFLKAVFQIFVFPFLEHFTPANTPRLTKPLQAVN